MCCVCVCVCEAPCARRLIYDHTNKCNSRPTPCPHCGQKIAHAALVDHYKICDYMVVSCDAIKDVNESEAKGCGKKMLRSELTAHQLKDCPKAPIVCPYGCTESIHRDALSAHEKQCITQHVHHLCQSVIALKKENAELKLALGKATTATTTKKKIEPFFYVVGGESHCGGWQTGVGCVTPALSANVFAWNGEAWLVLPQLPATLQHTSAARIGTDIVMSHCGVTYGTGSGGRAVSAAERHIMKFDLNTHNWCHYTIPVSNDNPRGEAVGHVCSIAIDHKLYLIGLLSYCLDPTNGASTRLPGFNKESAALAMDPANDKRFFIFGGCGYTHGVVSRNTTERYDTVTNTTTILRPSPLQRFGHQSVVTKNGKILLMGGCLLEAGSRFVNLTAAPCLNVVEEYDPITDSWLVAEKTLRL